MPGYPRSGAANEYTIPMQARPASTLPEPRATSAGNKYDLPALIDIALSNNPDTRQTWYQARAAAAAYGSSRAPFYPVVSAQVPGGYEREIFQLPGQNAVLRQWQITPMLEFTYTLLDFGRRRRRRSLRACATGGRKLLVQPQAAGCRVRNAALVLCDRRGEGRRAGGGTKRRAREDRRRGRQPPRRPRSGHSSPSCCCRASVSRNRSTI